MYNKKRLVFFFFVSTLFNLSASFAHPVTPTLFKNLGLGDYMFGYALAAMMTCNFLFSPFWGKMNSFLSSRVSLLISCLGYALGQVFFATATTEAGILLARALAGTFTGGCFVSCTNYIINMAPDEKTRGSWLAVAAAIMSVGGAFGYFIGGTLGAINIQYALVAQIVTLSLCGILFLFSCENDAREPLKNLDPKRLAREANPFAAFVESGKFMTVLLAVMFAMTAFHYLGQTAFDQSFNYYIKDQFDFSSAYNGILKAAMGFITLIANSTICVYLIHKTDVRKSTIGVFVLCSVTMLAIILIESVAPFLIINVLFYAFSSILMPLLQDIAASNAQGKDSNLVMGFFNSIRSLGGILGAFASGALYTFNPKLPFVCSFLAFAVGVFCSAFFYKKSVYAEKAR